MFFFITLLTAAAIDLTNKLGKVAWPTTTWVMSPVSSTSWHEGETVTLTIAFSSTVGMDSGIVEVILPSDFDDQVLTYDLESGVVALDDYLISFDNIVLPAAGVYGPVAVQLKYVSGGSVVAINQFFATLFIETAKPVPEDDTLTAAFYDLTKEYVKDSSSIYFDFMISQDLWKYDVFYLYIDSHFTLASPVCKSQKVIGEYNNLNSSSSSSLNTLPCVYEEEFNRVKIYGLGVDIYVDKLSSYGNITGRLLVTGFTNPDADYENTAYSWELYIGRYGVNTFIAAYKGSGPSTSSGHITVSSWKPSKSDYDKDSIPLGLTLYMDLTFTTSHDIPKTGSIKFKFSGGVDNTAKSWRFTTSGKQEESLGDDGYYFISPYVGGTCSFGTATELICKGFDSDIKAGTLVLTTYTYFLSTSPSIMTITSYVDDTQTTIIDQVTANPASIVYGSSEVMDAADYFNVFFTDGIDSSTDSKYLAKTGNEAKYMIIKLQIPESMSSTEVKVRVPLSTSSRLKNIKSITTATGDYATSTTNDELSTLSFSSLSSVTISGEIITFSVTADASDYVTIKIELSSTNFKFPYVGSNLLTRYEAYVELKPDEITYKYAKGLTFILDSPTVELKLACSDANIPGLPATISFTSNFDFTLSSSFDSNIESAYKFYMDITFTGLLSDDLDSGLSPGDNYPYYSSSIGNLKLSTEYTPGLLCSDFTTVSSSTAFSVTFPFGKMTHLYYYYTTVLVYYIDPDRTDVKYEILSSTSDDTALQSTSSSTAWTDQSISGTTSFKTSESLGTLSISLTEAASASGVLGFIFPQGFTISSGTISLSGSVLGSFAFSSSDIYFKTPGIFTTTSVSNTLAVASVFSLTGITTSTFFDPSSSVVSIWPIHSKGDNSLCNSATGTKPTLVLQPGTIDTPTFTPISTTGAGPGFLNLDITVKFKNTHKIQLGGKIVLEFASDWQVTITSQASITVKGKSVDATISDLDTTFSIKDLAAIDAGSEIVVTVTDVVPPTNNDVANTLVGHFSKISTYATEDDTEKIDEWTDSTSDTLTLKPSPSSKNMTVYPVELFPNSTSPSAFFGIEFSSKNTLPKGTVITITSPEDTWLHNGDVSAYITFSVLFYYATASNENLKIMLAEECAPGVNMTLIFDHALLIDKSGKQDAKVKVTSDYYGIEVDGVEDEGLDVYVATKMTDMIISLEIDPVTACEYGNYTFTIGSKITKDSSILFVFPIEYDYFLGRVSRTYAVTNPSIYFIPCTSTFGSIECEIQHRTVKISIPKDIEQQSITLIGMFNPNFTNSDNYVKAYAYSSTGSISGYEYIPITGISAPYYNNIKIRRLQKTVNYLQKLSDYTFEFYLNEGTTYSGDHLILTFPESFDLNRDLDSALTCTLQFIDTSGSLSLKSEIKTTKKCYSIKKNQIKLTLLESFNWTETTMAHLTILSLLNPEFTKEMTSPLDSKVYTVFDQYTLQFGISVLNGSEFISKSFQNMNTAYLGFYKNSYSFEVNSYNPFTYEGTIILIPGTQSKDIYITTSAFKSKNAKLNALNVNNEAVLEFDSTKKFKFYTGDTSVPFRVSAAIDQPYGLNYISWSIDETTQDASLGIYTAPVKTRVEVYQGKAKVTVGKIPDIAVGFTSLPISVSVDYSPHTELIVAILTSEANLTVYPSTLTFTRGLNTLYYQIEVSENFTSSSLTITYELSGTDVEAYEIQASTFKVKSDSSSIPQIKSLTFSSVGRTSMKATVATDQISVVCWQLTEASNPSWTLEEIQQTTASLIGDNGEPSFEEQGIAYEDSVPSEPDSTSTWKLYQRNYYKDFLTQSFTGCAFNGLTTIQLFNVDWLWAETSYKVVVYAGYEESNYTGYQSTSNFAGSVYTTVSIAQSMDKSLITDVTNGLSKSLGISSYQLEQFQFDQTSTSAKVYYYIYPDRHSPYAPIDLAKAGTYSYLRDALKAKGIIGTVTVVNNEIARTADGQNVFLTFLVKAYSKNSITLEIFTLDDGEICCAATNQENIGQNTIKQLIGLDDDNNQIKVGTGILEFNKTKTLTISGLSGNHEYNITCFGFDDYNIWPNYINKQTAISETMSDESSSTTVVSGATYLEIALGCLFISLT